MTIDDLKQLAGRADDLTDRSADRLAEVHHRVRRIRRRVAAEGGGQKISAEIDTSRR